MEKALQHPWVRGVAASGEHMEEAQTNIKLFNARRKMKVRLIVILTHCRLNELSHTIYWKSRVSILGMSGDVI